MFGHESVKTMKCPIQKAPLTIKNIWHKLL